MNQFEVFQNWSLGKDTELYRTGKLRFFLDISPVFIKGVVNI